MLQNSYSAEVSGGFGDWTRLFARLRLCLENLLLVMGVPLWEIWRKDSYVRIQRMAEQHVRASHSSWSKPLFSLMILEFDCGCPHCYQFNLLTWITVLMLLHSICVCVFVCMQVALALNQNQWQNITCRIWVGGFCGWCDSGGHSVRHRIISFGRNLWPSIPHSWLCF